MVYENSTAPELSPTFTCALTPQYVNVFERAIPHSVTVTLCVFNIAFAIITTSLNLLVMAAIISTPKLQTPTFILLCNLALTDFAIGLVIGSTEVVYLITRAVGQYDRFCTTWKVLVVLSYFLCPASLYTITSISYDRYLSLLMRVKYKTVVTRKRACITVVILWVWSALGTTLMGVLGKGPFLILVCCVTFFCLVVIIDCYLLSFAAIRQHQKEIMSSTLTPKKKSKSDDKCRKEVIRLNQGRKGIKRPLESFGREYDELKRTTKSRDVDVEKEGAIGQCRSRDFQTENDDIIGQWDSMEDFYNESLKYLDTENDEIEATGGQEESLSDHLSIQNANEDNEKRRQTFSSASRESQFKISGGKARHTLDPTKPKYILVNKDIESVIEKVEMEDKHVRKVESKDNLNDEITRRNEKNPPEDTIVKNRPQSPRCDDPTKLTIRKAELLTDVKKFKQTLNTILIIVVALFLCYLPYLVVSTLVTLHIIDIGIAWDLAAVTVYMNSSISPIIMCTRIANIRKACRRILRRIFRV